MSTYTGLLAEGDIAIVHAVYDLTLAHYTPKNDKAVCGAEGDAYHISNMVTCLRCIAMMTSPGWFNSNSNPEESRWLLERSKTTAGP